MLPAYCGSVQLAAKPPCCRAAVAPSRTGRALAYQKGRWRLSHFPWSAFCAAFCFAASCTASCAALWADLSRARLSVTAQHGSGPCFKRHMPRHRARAAWSAAWRRCCACARRWSRCRRRTSSASLAFSFFSASSESKKNIRHPLPQPPSSFENFEERSALTGLSKLSSEPRPTRDCPRVPWNKLIKELMADLEALLFVHRTTKTKLAENRPSESRYLTPASLQPCSLHFVALTNALTPTPHLNSQWWTLGVYFASFFYALGFVVLDIL